MHELHPAGSALDRHTRADDDRFLAEALSLAQQTAAFASPNPAVGCVLVRDGRVIGRGAHRYDLLDHAEIVALKDAAAGGESAHGATAYVTLEPCSHHGRTGPCAHALIAAGVVRVVAATVDPNPIVRGEGFRRLVAAGVEVQVYYPSSVLAVAARRVNDAFAFSVQQGRPFVTLKAAVSSDGMLAPRQRQETAPVWLTDAEARADVQRLRHASDALLTGLGTVLADNPALTDRTQQPRRRSLLRCVLDSQLRLPPEAQMLQNAADDVVIFTAEESLEREAAKCKQLTQRGARRVAVPQDAAGRLHLPAVLAWLEAQQVRSVLLECGAYLNAAMLQADLVDKVVLFESPLKLGADGIPFSADGVTANAVRARLRGVTYERFSRSDGAVDSACSGYLHDPYLHDPCLLDPPPGG
jgi:diaminohydroxyphosphoribosylaminopyrimidine deaminase/5-amino-6-(5-phosphoribosylamino)uracil reductase